MKNNSIYKIDNVQLLQNYKPSMLRYALTTSESHGYGEPTTVQGWRELFTNTLEAINAGKRINGCLSKNEPYYWREQLNLLDEYEKRMAQGVSLYESQK